MRVYVSVDMEGVAGVATLSQIMRGGAGYPRAQALMTAEANAAVDGAFAAGATDVTVNDSHGPMDNLLHSDLDQRARVVFGAPNAQCMAQGLRRGMDVALFVGYHAGSGAPGLLAHTFSPHFTQLRINGRAQTEAEVNALYAASLGVPVGLVTGDEAICAVAAQAFPAAVTVAVKRAEGFTAADSVHPETACADIRAGAARAVESAADLQPLEVPTELVVEIDVTVAPAAELAMFVPGAERLAELTLRRSVADATELLRLINAWSYLATSGAQKLAGH